MGVGRSPMSLDWATWSAYVMLETIIFKKNIGLE